MKNISAYSRSSKNLVTYFILAYAITWSVGIPLALGELEIIPKSLPLWAHYFVAYGPMLSALILTWFDRGRDGLRDIGKRIIQWRVHPLLWFAAFSPLVVGFLVVFVLNLGGNEPISLSEMGEVSFLPPLGIGALALWIFTFGIGEEVGWRGYALPRLQKNYNALQSTLILGLVWELWHLPQFFYLFDPSVALGWAVSLLAGAVVFTWLFNSSGGSVLIVAIWHGCFNFVTASTAGNGTVATAVSIAVTVGAVVVVIFFKPENLSNRERYTIR